MRLHQLALAAVVASAIPVAAAAQTSQATSTAQAQGTTTATTTTTRTTEDTDFRGNEWIASGFVGSNFGASADTSTVDFGGSFGYLWKKAIGAEFLASFTPDFQLRPAQSNILFGDRPQVNSYMVNAIGALPLGADGRWQPFISGGVGAVTLRSDVFNSSNGNAVSNTLNPDDTHFGGNIGAGIMGYVGNWGVRGDVRYFRATNSDVTTNGTNPIASNLLSGLDFWRANIGVAVRW